jgi:hypothetical protein
MKVEIGETKWVEGSMILEIVFSGEYPQGDPRAAEEARTKVEAFVRAPELGAVLLNFLDIDEIPSRELHSLIDLAAPPDHVRGRRPCGIAIGARQIITSRPARTSIVNPEDILSPTVRGSSREDCLSYLEEAVKDRAADPPGERPVYFPERTLGQNQWLHDLKSFSYSARLWRMREPSFLDLAKDPFYEGYRFLWLGSFDEPVCVRLEIGSIGTGTLTVKKISDQGGRFPGRFVLEMSDQLSESQVGLFLDALRKAAFWKQPTRIEDCGLDGADWVVEGVKGYRYHVVVRWSPRTGPFREAALLLVQLGGLITEEIY